MNKILMMKRQKGGSYIELILIIAFVLATILLTYGYYTKDQRKIVYDNSIDLAGPQDSINTPDNKQITNFSLTDKDKGIQLVPKPHFRFK